jgi:hypothetical protein
VKRLVSVLALGGALAIGASSQAAAAGDPLVVDQCARPVGCLPILSVGQLTGPQLGDLVCTPESQFSTGQIGLPISLDPSGFNNPPALQVTICKQ